MESQNISTLLYLASGVLFIMRCAAQFARYIAAWQLFWHGGHGHRRCDDAGTARQSGQ